MAMTADDLERLAVAAYLTGRDHESADAWVRAYHEWLRAGHPAGAARCGFWLGFLLLLRGEDARGRAWLLRAQRVLDDGDPDCAERGFLLVPAALDSMDQGDLDAARATIVRVLAIAERCADADLMAFGRLSHGQVLIASGSIPEGMASLDEAMVAVTAGEVSAITAGIVYCAVLLECQDTFDLRRAQEWTAAFSRWCEDQPDAVPYRGQCLVHRAELLQLHGEWHDAMQEARRACDHLSGHAAIGTAFYQQAELHRLRGEIAQADEAYREASRWGREPQPGLALLRLAQGRADAATAAIRRTLEQARDPLPRSKLLPAYVEIMLAVDDTPAARAAADELSAIAAAHDAPLLRAVAGHARGAVLLGEGTHQAACEALRAAWKVWQDLDAPYEAARARVLLGDACRRLGDDEAAEMELDAARRVFQQLSAAPDLARVEKLSGKSSRTGAAGLTARELQVLGLVTAGKTNREIAAALVISDHTVRRHLQNIFAKLRVSSRAAATAFAFQHDLV
jgi:ATP/maltotriose-dependent transcriptional regulator MalT